MNASRSTPDQVADVWVSVHALARVRELHPTAGWRGALRILAESRPLPRAEVAGFLRRSLESCRDEYFLSPKRQGIFVVAPGRAEHLFARTLVTYIVLSVSQVEAAERLWG